MVLPATHTFIMNRRDVAEEIMHFLHRGRFQGEEAGGCAVDRSERRPAFATPPRPALTAARGGYPLCSATSSTPAYGTSRR